MSTDNYRNKYLKYKNKYLELKKQQGGTAPATPFSIDEVSKIVKRNDTYIEEHKIKEEKAKIASEPQGDWQSPSDNARWFDFQETLKLARFEWNINKSVAKEKERDLLKNSIQTINQKIESNDKAIEKINKQTSFFSFLKSAEQERQERLKKADLTYPIRTENDELERLKKNIPKQVNIYNKLIARI
jgi:hypothetical protein